MFMQVKVYQKTLQMIFESGSKFQNYRIIIKYKYDIQLYLIKAISKMEASSHQDTILPITHTQKSTHHHTYNSHPLLSNKKHGQIQPSQIAERLNQDTIHHIQHEIIESKITVSSASRNAVTRQSRNDEPPPQKLHEIMKKKKQLNEEMARLKYEESRVKEHHRIIQKKTRSQFTKEEHEQIAKALEAQRLLDEEIKLKNQRLEQALEEKRLHEEAQKRANIDEICKEKQKQIVEHLQELENKKEQREKEIRQLNKRYQSVKGRTFLHEKMEKMWILQQKKHEAQDKEVLSVRRKGKQFSMRSIIQHEKKYRTFVTNTSKQKEDKVKQERLQKELMEKQTLSHYQPSRFLQTIFEEEKKMKQAEINRNNTIRALAQTKAKYGDNIREINKEMLEKRRSLPPIKEHTQEQLNNEEQIKNKNKISEARSSKSMSRLEIAEIGNRYLREVHSSIDHIDPKQKSITIPKKQSEQQIYKYQDYLQDLKRQRASKQSNPELREISELKKVLKKNSNAEDKLYYAKIIAGKLQNNAKGDTSKLISSINAKLAIIDQFCN